MSATQKEMHFGPCHHTWHQVSTKTCPELGTVEYVHECPSCGYVKNTLRKISRLDDGIKLNRDLERLVRKANAKGYTLSPGGCFVKQKQ